MNALTLIVASALILMLGYRFYGAFIAAKVLALDSSVVTPAIRLLQH